MWNLFGCLKPKTLRIFHHKRITKHSPLFPHVCCDVTGRAKHGWADVQPTGLLLWNALSVVSVLFHPLSLSETPIQVTHAFLFFWYPRVQVRAYTIFSIRGWQTPLFCASPCAHSSLVCNPISHTMSLATDGPFSTPRFVVHHVFARCCSARWRSAASEADTSEELVRAIRALKPGATDKLQWTVEVTKASPRVVWSQRVTTKGGFVDLQTFTLEPTTEGNGGQGKVITAESFARDKHLWSALCPCLGGTCGLWVACFLCSCGVCPTKDWGANQALLDAIQAEASLVDKQP